MGQHMIHEVVGTKWMELKGSVFRLTIFLAIKSYFLNVQTLMALAAVAMICEREGKGIIVYLTLVW